MRNDHYLADALWDAGIKAVGAENVKEKPLSMGAEDFSHYAYYKPGAMFNLGVMPASGKYVPLHNGKMMVNEDVLDVAPNVFIQFVLDQMEK